MPKYYIGITIGPIIETLCMASRPASLWCASAMFSWLSEDICKKVIALNGEVISPYYPKENKKINYSVTTGVGKYHDRIIFTVESENAESLKKIVTQMLEAAKKSLAEELTKPFEIDAQSLSAVIQDYLQTHYVIVNETEIKGKNRILALSPYLDALELCPTFTVDQSIQPILTLFEGKDYETHNNFVKQCFNLDKNANVVINGKVRKIESIADSVPSSDRKIFDYYAIVQADGDSMGELLKSLTDDVNVKRFSEICLNYTTEAASKINEFGGMTIYAGGDDLLFISPLENNKGETIFSLLNDISATFHQSFGVYSGNTPTLSFGISINHRKFPLYEALKDALNLLLFTAKATVKEGEVKNKTAVHIRKHSGQSLQFRYLNQGVIYEQLSELMKAHTDTVFLHSMLYKISLYRPILIAALEQGKDLSQTFENLFDSDYHGGVADYIQKVAAVLATIYTAIKGNAEKNYALEKLHDKKAETDEELAIDLLYSMLRTVRFFTEKKGEK
jgi:CRISPR-associated protein Cmr2